MMFNQPCHVDLIRGNDYVIDWANSRTEVGPPFFDIQPSTFSYISRWLSNHDHQLLLASLSTSASRKGHESSRSLQQLQQKHDSSPKCHGWTHGLVLQSLKQFHHRSISHNRTPNIAILAVARYRLGKITKPNQRRPQSTVLPDVEVQNRVS